MLITKEVMKFLGTMYIVIFLTYSSIERDDIVILFIWCKILFINELIETRQGNYIDGVTKETAKHQKTS